MERMKVAVVGCGSISQVYMENLTSGKFEILELVACSDLVTERMNANSARFGCAAMTLDDICKDSSIEMVINLTIPAAHYDVTKQCLEAGKHVFSEKMLAVELWQGKELLQLADEKGVYLGVAPDTFLGASLQTARYIVEAGLIGQPVSCQASISRDYGVYGEFLPHLCKRGGGIGFDMGSYYLTALAAILGPVQEVSAFASVNEPNRINTRVGAANCGEAYVVEDCNVITAALKFRNGVLGTLHMNADCILDETYALEIYGTEGILYMGNPNEFGSAVCIKKTKSSLVAFPMTHGFSENSRGVGAAEMAWAIRTGRKNRASKEMAYHVFEQIHGIMRSSEDGKTYIMESSFDIPVGLPAGYIGNGEWTRKEESALI